MELFRLSTPGPLYGRLSVHGAQRIRAVYTTDVCVSASSQVTVLAGNASTDAVQTTAASSESSTDNVFVDDRRGLWLLQAGVPGSTPMHPS